MWYYKVFAVIIALSQFLEVKFHLTAVLGILGPIACNYQNGSNSSCIVCLLFYFIYFSIIQPFYSKLQAVIDHSHSKTGQARNYLTTRPNKSSATIISVTHESPCMPAQYRCTPSVLVLVSVLLEQINSPITKILVHTKI